MTADLSDVELAEIDTCDEIRAAWNLRCNNAEHRAQRRLTRAELRVDARDIRALLATLDGLVEGLKQARRELECAQTALTEAFTEANVESDRLIVERDAALAQVEAVRALHRPEPYIGRQVCSTCLEYTSPMPGRITWPCPTVRALDVVRRDASELVRGFASEVRGE